MKNIKIKLEGIYLLFYAAFACYYPFLITFYEEKGLSYTQIGIAFAVGSIAGVIIQPIWGYITDKYLNKRLSIIITMILSAVIILTYILANSFFWIIIVLLAFITFHSPISSITDAYCYEIIDEYKSIDYGKIRLMGSLGYAVSALIMGFVIKALSSDFIFFGYCIFICLASAIIISFNFKGKRTSSQLKLKEVGKVLNDKRFIIFSIAIVLINITFGVNSNYLAVLINKTGGDVSKLGLMWFIIAISELPAFFFSNKLFKRFGIINLLGVSIVFYILRYFLDSISSNYTMIIIIQLLQGVTYPLYLMAALQYVNKIVPKNLQTTGITLYSAIGGGIGGFTGNLFGGIFLEWFSVFMLFKVLSVICLIGLSAVFILKRVDVNYCTASGDNLI
ncbi:MAG: transporter [Clostridiaceae bacterium]|jgi:MFS family permease|nr:transporter [Clostridiaceae bacterium]